MTTELSTIRCPEYDQQALSAKIVLLAAADLEVHQAILVDLANESRRPIRADPFENTLALLLEGVTNLGDFDLKHVNDAGAASSSANSFR
ncbi:hypothetical protein ATY81_08020 [Rhizobium sp. R72]|nr:hypothetical protein ATY81_08020 [Rhizobium sp. R72]OWV97713.1 hypothetical protein ATY80_08020 [Rhizobium sp. R711]